MKVAETLWAAETVSVQLPTPEQPAPAQPAKVEPAAGMAVRVSEVPASKADAQVAPQSSPDGALVTDPEPVPCLLTLTL